MRCARLGYACGRRPHPPFASQMPPSPEGKAFYCRFAAVVKREERKVKRCGVPLARIGYAYGRRMGNAHPYGGGSELLRRNSAAAR